MINKLLTIAVIDVILGFTKFIGFSTSSSYIHSFFGLSFLGEFLSICCLIVFFISTSLILSIKTPRYNE